MPEMFPEAISWRTSFAVIGHAEPSMRVQSLAAASFDPAAAAQCPNRGAPQAFSAAL